ncbi:MAG: hypothetical protein KF799_11110 [Bdellovibrionales bacterium]|nr:hypothetical protein [Bdellovibrionales bacterium]
MKYVLIVLVSLVCLPAMAEEKTCTITPMDCAGCVDMVKEKVCNPEFTLCDVAIVDSDKKIGQIHVKTKDAATKVDPKMLTDLIKDTTYSVSKCTAGAPKPAAGKGKKTS